MIDSQIDSQIDGAALRKHLVELLRGGDAHVDFEKAIDGLPANLRGARAQNLSFTPWRLLEHLRIAQWDILEFSRNAKHISPKWPDEYWPVGDAPPNAKAWNGSVASFRKNLKEMEALVQNPATNLFAKISHGKGQTILREALLVADHNAYHIGELVMLRKLLGAWDSK